MESNTTKYLSTCFSLLFRNVRIFLSKVASVSGGWLPQLWTWNFTWNCFDEVKYSEHFSISGDSLQNECIDKLIESSSKLIMLEMLYWWADEQF